MSLVFFMVHYLWRFPRSGLPGKAGAYLGTPCGSSYRAARDGGLGPANMTLRASLWFWSAIIEGGGR